MYACNASYASTAFYPLVDWVAEVTKVRRKCACNWNRIVSVQTSHIRIWCIVRLAVSELHPNVNLNWSVTKVKIKRFQFLIWYCFFWVDNSKTKNTFRDGSHVYIHRLMFPRSYQKSLKWDTLWKCKCIFLEKKPYNKCKFKI